MSIPFKRAITKEQALEKARHFCAYQERCHLEVRGKLYSFGLHRQDVEYLMAQLIEESYLDEQRFAIQYSGGKFRIKKWGKLKIRDALKQKQVGEYCIKRALQEIDKEAYLLTLEKLAQRKFEMLNVEKNLFLRKKKTKVYLLQKGYEMELVTEMVDGLNPTIQ